MNAITEPTWDALGDKELAAIILSRTGETVVPGNMAHAVLVAKAQRAFRSGATETADGLPSASLPISTARDTVPQGAGHAPLELAESASGNPLTEDHPEGRAMGQPNEPVARPAVKPAAKK